MKLRTIYIILLLALTLPMASLEAKKADSKELKIERKELLRQQRAESALRRQQQKAEKKALRLQQKELAGQRRAAQKAQKLARKIEKKAFAAQARQLRKEQRQERASQRKMQKVQTKDLRLEQRVLAKQKKKSGVPPGEAAVVTRKDRKMQRKELRQEQRQNRISLRSEQVTAKTAVKQQRKEVVVQQRVERKALKQEHKSEKKELKADRREVARVQRTVRLTQRKQHRSQRKDVSIRVKEATAPEQKVRHARQQERKSPKRENKGSRKKVAKEQRSQRQGHRKQHSQQQGQRFQHRGLGQGLNRVMPDLAPASSDWVVAARRDHGVRRGGSTRSSTRTYRQGPHAGRREYRGIHAKRLHRREHRWRRRHYRRIKGHKAKATIHVYGIFDYRPRYIYPRGRTVYVYPPADTVIVRDRVIVYQPVGGSIDPQDALSFKQEGLILQALVGSATERENAVGDLAEFKSLASVAVLIDALINDAELSVRAGAAASLGAIGDAIAYEPLLRSAQAEREETVRDAALAAVETIALRHDLQRPPDGIIYPPMNRGGNKLGEHLEDLRLGDSSARKDAAEALALEDHHGTQAVAALIDALINDPDADVRKEAAESLGKIGDPMALDFLKAARDGDIDEGVWKKAEKAIEKIYESISQPADAYRYG